MKRLLLAAFFSAAASFAWAGARNISTTQALPFPAMMLSPISACHRRKLARPNHKQSPATPTSQPSTTAKHSPSPVPQTANCSRPTLTNMFRSLMATAHMASPKVAKFRATRTCGASWMTSFISTSQRTWLVSGKRTFRATFPSPMATGPLSSQQRRPQT
jgi:hypothetical protein